MKQEQRRGRVEALDHTQTQGAEIVVEGQAGDCRKAILRNGRRNRITQRDLSFSAQSAEQNQSSVPIGVIQVYNAGVSSSLKGGGRMRYHKIIKLYDTRF
jgi:hypothetical protein